MFYIKNLLTYILLLPLLGAFFLVITPSTNKNLLRLIALNISCLTFLLSLVLWVFFDKSVSTFQFVNKFSWMPLLFNINFTMGIDGISLFFILLTTLLIPLCLLVSWDSIKFNLKEYLLAFLIMEFFLIGVFCILDLFLFYIFFESSLIPMFFLVGVWGSRTRKVRASYLLFIYTFWGSVLFILAILFVYLYVGCCNFEIIFSYDFCFEYQIFLWFAFFIAFASKVPILPFHLWLPEAHVEASTAGSVVLAGILLKLGVYGFIRFVLQICPKACIWFSPLLYTICCISVVYTSLTAIRQTDLKRIIAYTSVAHMNLVILGVFSFSTEGLEGAVFQSLCHGFVSSALFFLIGVLYDRHRTRLIKYISGLVVMMPIFSIFFLFFTMSNIALPATGSFIGEFLILVGTFKSNTTVCFISATGMILGGGYSLWLYNRIIFGNLKIQFLTIFQDLEYREVLILKPLFLGTLAMGIFPSFFLKRFQFDIEIILANHFF